MSAACFAAFLFAFDELPNFGDFDNCEHLGAVSTYGRGTRFRFGGAVPVNGFLNPRCLAHPPVPVVDVVDGVATVESTNIAEVFEKRHDHVLRDIENILISLPSERRDNFIEIQLDRINNFGATVQSKAYRLTRDGFTFLVMGYTGEKAARFKWAYIDEFNRQQTLLESKALPPTQSERTMFAGDSLAENVLRGLSGQMDAETVGDKLVTIGTVLQVVGTIQKVPASGPQLQAALNAFQQALEESCDADELEKQRRRSLKARNAARARWDRIRQGGAE